METGFTYKIIPTCQYGVYCQHTIDHVDECGEPSFAKVRWSEKENWFYLCEKHFDYVIECEEEDN